MKRLNIPSAIVGLVFGVISVGIANQYLQPAVAEETVYAYNCAEIQEVRKTVTNILNNCKVGSNNWLYC